MKLHVYVDGFNLYYGCLKDTPYRWLDVLKMCTLRFPQDEIVRIKYFTAPIKIRMSEKDPDRPNRQQIYLRALRTIPNLDIIEGVFLSHKVSMKLARGDGYALVIKNEEKGTDVNIASYLVHDAHHTLFKKAVVISNDSDLVTPIKIVTKEIGLPVTIVSPFDRNSIQLKDVATDVKHIRKGLLKVSQFNEKLNDATGEFSIPEKWKDHSTQKNIS
ncbi:MAG: NYN domain-containing protein [Patescibacteria group bacterium]|nr:NYN domain-containing protein [Patescibacteria group bacterium]